MSDSDDTDVLLLVPPDFFLINSPQCTSPIDEECSVKCVDDIFTRRVETFVDIMEDGYPNSSPFRYRSYKSVFPANRNNQFSPIQCSDLSVEKANGPKVNDEFFQNNFNKTKKTDVVVSDTSKPEKLTDRLNENGLNVENESGQSPKFSLRQVDKLLSEMEKTRAEIKNKLQANKNKIHEMRREYASNNSGGALNRSHRSVIVSSARNEVSSSSKPENTNDYNATRKPMNTDLSVLTPSEPKNLLHLTKIMSNDNDFETLRQKLEAETMKRKHCEEMIQQLQISLLEHQQNINVAFRIDAQKDEIIGQLRHSWMQLVEHWKELELQRQDLARMIERERLEATNTRNSYQQKSEQLEARLLEAVSLANGYREKNDKLEKTFNEIREGLRRTEEDVKLLKIEKLELQQQLEHTTENLSNEKEKHLSAESRVADLQVQISSVSREKSKLEEKYIEEKDLNDLLKSEIAKLKLNYTRASSAELAALKEANNVKQELTKIKNSLKEFYQKQLDTVLREKVDEFQKEIDKAHATMHLELRKHEKLAEEKLQSEIGRLQEAHKLELSEERRINQKHVNILKGELKEGRKKILDLENRVKLDTIAKEKLSELIQSAAQNQQIDMLNDGLDNILDGSSKEFPRSGHEKLVEYTRMGNNDEDVSDFDFNRDQNFPADLRKYVEMLLDREPGHPVEKEMLLRALFSDRDCTTDRKTNNQRQNDNYCRRKPPWK